MSFASSSRSTTAPTDDNLSHSSSLFSFNIKTSQGILLLAASEVRTKKVTSPCFICSTSFFPSKCSKLKSFRNWTRARDDALNKKAGTTEIMKVSSPSGSRISAFSHNDNSFPNMPAGEFSRRCNDPFQMLPSMMFCSILSGTPDSRNTFAMLSQHRWILRRSFPPSLPSSSISTSNVTTANSLWPSSTYSISPHSQGSSSSPTNF
mmetsp:Transcript_43132/g.80073  ORF Transcript_43132/g.80073 Transcript_43132/m.80073 type:complete len:206 (+) Transcript_43132:409-1026(+)